MIAAWVADRDPLCRDPVDSDVSARGESAHRDTEVHLAASEVGGAGQLEDRGPQDQAGHHGQRFTDRGRVGSLSDAEHPARVVGTDVDHTERADVGDVDDLCGDHRVRTAGRQFVHRDEVRAAEEDVIAEGDAEQVTVLQLPAQGQQRCSVAVTVGEVLGHRFDRLFVPPQVLDIGRDDGVPGPGGDNDAGGTRPGAFADHVP